MSGSKKAAEQPERVLVVSSSRLLWRRLEQPLSAAGYAAENLGGVEELLRLRRHRPFLLCFLDVRACGAGEVSECLRARPGERYVLLRGAVNGSGRAGGAEEPGLFGYLREPIAGDEVASWCRRAATEARLMQGDRSLDDILYGRFRAFLQNLGPSDMARLHELVSERVERPLLTAVLEWTGGNQTRAAQILGLHRNTLRTKIRTLGIGRAKPWEGDL
jgi:Fis family transcriptional regulator